MELYREMGIRPSVYRFGEEIEAQLKERFEAIDKMAEYNQLKVIRATCVKLRIQRWYFTHYVCCCI